MRRRVVMKPVTRAAVPVGDVVRVVTDALTHRAGDRGPAFDRKPRQVGRVNALFENHPRRHEIDGAGPRVANLARLAVLGHEPVDPGAMTGVGAGSGLLSISSPALALRT